MKMKFNINLWIWACGLGSIVSVLMYIIFDVSSDTLLSTLINAYILALILCIIVPLITFLCAKGKVLYYFVYFSIFAVIVFAQQLLSGYIKTGEFKILFSLMIAFIGVVSGVVALLLFNLYKRLKNKSINEKLKEYQDKHKD